MAPEAMTKDNNPRPPPWKSILTGFKNRSTPVSIMFNDIKLVWANQPLEHSIIKQVSASLGAIKFTQVTSKADLAAATNTEPLRD